MKMKLIVIIVLSHTYMNGTEHRRKPPEEHGDKTGYGLPIDSAACGVAFPISQLR